MNVAVGHKHVTNSPWVQIMFNLIANEPSERRRSYGEAAADKAAQAWAIGRKILDRAEKSVT